MHTKFEILEPERERLVAFLTGRLGGLYLQLSPTYVAPKLHFLPSPGSADKSSGPELASAIISSPPSTWSMVFKSDDAVKQSHLLGSDKPKPGATSS